MPTSSDAHDIRASNDPRTKPQVRITIDLTQKNLIAEHDPWIDKALAVAKSIPPPPPPATLAVVAPTTTTQGRSGKDSKAKEAEREAAAAAAALAAAEEAQAAIHPMLFSTWLLFDSIYRVTLVLDSNHKERTTVLHTVTNLFSILMCSPPCARLINACTLQTSSKNHRLSPFAVPPPLLSRASVAKLDYNYVFNRAGGVLRGMNNRLPESAVLFFVTFSIFHVSCTI